MSSRQELVTAWAHTLNAAIGKGAFGIPIRLTGVRAVAGPRCGAVEMLAGVSSDKLYAGLAKAKRAVLRQTVPWQFTSNPIVCFNSRFIRVEAGWPKELAQRVIPLESISQKPEHPNKWVVGRNEHGTTIVMSLNDRTPHILVSGMTGSGKSTALCNAVYQLSKYPENEIVLLDGKFGDTLRDVEHLSAYPMCLSYDDVRAALAWAMLRAKKRIQNRDRSKRTILFFDEFQKFVDDKQIAALLARIAQQGRSGNVNLILAAQHPTVKAFGGEGSTGRCLPGALAFMVKDHVASRVAVGGPAPRADYLLGEGDGYTVTPTSVHRIQGAWIDRRLTSTRQRVPYCIDDWPEPDWEALDMEAPKTSRAPPYTVDEIAHALITAKQDKGRPFFMKLFGDGDKPGNSRADRVLALMRSALERVQEYEAIN